MKTSTVRPPAPKWLIVDASGQSLGKIAVKTAMVLKGKHRATYSPHQLCGDHVIVVNAAKIALPPKKGLRKTYYRHTGFPGNMRVTSLTTMMRSKPTYVVEHAVKGMLPDNRLAKQMLKRLHVYADMEHPYEAQKPQTLSLTPAK